jgi:hypothetical protein
MKSPVCCFISLRCENSIFDAAGAGWKDPNPYANLSLAMCWHSIYMAKWKQLRRSLENSKGRKRTML